MSKILKNTTGSAIQISDTGVTLDASPATYTIPQTDYLLWAASENVVTEIGNGTVIVNDGSLDLGISEGIDLIKGLFPSSINISGVDDGASPKDFIFEAASARIPKFDVFSAFGHNDSIKASEEGVWMKGGMFNWLDTGQYLSVKSTDNSDKYPSGTGARVLLITGIDENWDAITEQLLLNGTTNVTTTNKFLRINEAIVVNTGTTNTNEGDIDFKYNGVTYEHIGVGKSKLHSVKYSVPNGYRAYAVNGTFQSDDGSKGKAVSVNIQDNAVGVMVVAIPLRISSDFTLNPAPYLRIDARSDLYITARITGGSGTLEMSSGVTLLIEDIS